MQTVVRASLAVLALSLGLTGPVLADQAMEAQLAYELGDMHYFGEGVPVDSAVAIKWYREAAVLGHAQAQYNLGVMYRNGLGVPQDYAEAIKWYRKAAEQGNASAQFNLGLMYDNGTGLPQDYAEAVKWYRRAAEHGIASAQNNLGLMYSKGRGVPQDYIQAHKWYNLSAANQTDIKEREASVKNRDIVAAKMTSAQIAEAQKLAREWKPKSP